MPAAEFNSIGNHGQKKGSRTPRQVTCVVELRKSGRIKIALMTCDKAKYNPTLTKRKILLT
ncbi:hypothetical protein [Rufibacter sp. XAAS-G3-1]|uniref:hypothetical protein n=1 Tax=Rufibacter sp. XAAS-G3-1 TaxID=2729134 RepID=UPI0015E69031|nr:hypothetical protein [Rufibacter sp. XAAS-G3-1]